MRDDSNEAPQLGIIIIHFDVFFNENILDGNLF